MIAFHLKGVVILFNLTNKVAVITGCGSRTGIGFATAKVLAKAGAKVFITSTTERILERVQELRETFGKDKVGGISADLTNEKQVDKLVQECQSSFSKIDILVNNAGMVQVGYDEPSLKFENLTLKSWNYGIDINLTSTFLVTRKILPEIQRQTTGRIINVSSVTGPIVGINGSTVYSAAKAAMLGLTRSLAIEEGKNGITVNCIGPGWIKTGSSSEDEVKAGIFTPIGRPGTPEEIAHAILFLSSNESSYITGQILIVDGGNTIQEYKVELGGG